MKKSILGFLLIFGISSTLFAEVDLISLATNGEFNEQSAGVKVLNEEEMSKVVGGATISPKTILNSYGVTNNSGTKISYTAYYKLIPERANELLPLNVDTGSGEYIPAVSATFNFLTNKVSIEIIGVSQYNPVYTRSADSYYANRLLTENNKRLYNQAENFIRQDKTSYRSMGANFNLKYR
ncbi:hypothetical protein [Helicobacter ganmani]|uniref:hypothetical protein n=1 Tax=Helicobacter ganmani TaxID=60246 RepID=UPI003A8A9B37